MVVADWLELGVLLFDDAAEGITLPECSDYLIEEQIYDGQDFCREYLESIFGELRIRAALHGPAYPITIDANQRLSCAAPWQAWPALTYCLLVSAAPFYSGYSEWVGGNYADQGVLFERITQFAMTSWLPTWEVNRTGWEGGTSLPLADLLIAVAGLTSESVRDDWVRWVGEREKDLGVDVAAVLRFRDNRSALPAIFAQCASGRNWNEKLGTPDTSRWKQLIALTHTPLRALTLPFRLSAVEYDTRRSQHKGLLMDRLRLLPWGPEADWLDAETSTALITWLESRRAWFNEKYGRQVSV